MTANHTPFPWHVVADWDEDGNARYTLIGCKKTCAPDAQLIEAAPKLLAQCDELQVLNQSRMRQILDQARETDRLKTRIEGLEAMLEAVGPAAEQTEHTEHHLEKSQPPEDWAQLMAYLYQAALSTTHTIDHDHVELRYDPKQPGHNAANQLLRRLQAALPPFPAVPRFTHVAQGKLDSLLNDGHRITGYAFERTRDDGTVQHGFITYGGLVGWWHPPSTLPEKQRQPDRSTNFQITELARRICWRYRHSSDPLQSHTYAFDRSTLLQFARAVEAGDHP